MDSKQLANVAKKQLKSDLPEISPGDTVKVTYKLKEKDKVRLQSFEGVVLSKANTGINQTITVRRISHGIGVEKIFPTHSPFIDSIESIKKGKPRRAKLYYLRSRVGKLATKVRSKRTQKKAPEKPE